MLFAFWRRWNRRKVEKPRRDRSSPSGRTVLTVERLECRDLLTTVNPLSLLEPATGSATPQSTPGPIGYTPAQIAHAYGFSQIYFNNGAVKGDGSGQTIAIVTAYDDPTIASDLHQFDVAFGLPDPGFTKVNQTGGSTMPVANLSWANETALDVEWAHAMAPGAKILLVEANSSGNSDLFQGVQYAARQPGVSVVSMSWGTAEFSGEASNDNTFTTPSGHQGVSFVASAGDTGAAPLYPAVSPNVLGVGGTTLSLNGSSYGSESAWTFGSGGISTIEARPSYQNGIVPQSNRTSPDVAYDANPGTGFAVYSSYGNSASAPWILMGGTSAGVPQWAALIAIANQGRALKGLGTLNGRTQLLPMLYQLPSSDFHDIVSGNNFGAPQYWAGPGYDLVTGRGSPYADRIVAALSGQPLFGPPGGNASPSPSVSADGFVLNLSNPFDAMAQDALFIVRGWLSANLNMIFEGLSNVQ
ncbi:MAG TPA: S53 family peptidase, partial [Gemmataceae bacterium]